MSSYLVNWQKRIRQITQALTLTSIFGIFILLGLPQALLAQVDTGSLTGTVTDTTGARMPNVGIALKSLKTGVVTSVSTTSAGTYVFGALLPGTYSLKATNPGFEASFIAEIKINVQQTPTVDIVMTPGAVTEQVTVTSAAPLLEAQSAEVGQTIDETAVNDLPLNGRDWTSLGQLGAGVTTVQGGNSSSSLYSVNGVAWDNNDFRLNGVDDNAAPLIGYQQRGVYGGNAAIIPPPDAIEEFKIQSGDFDAEIGRATGAVINAVIKSGGSKVHGDLWEYIRNNDFDANDYFSKRNDISIPEYRQNQFGGTVGGPVFIPKLYNQARTKTFFFFDYQGTRIVQPSPATSTVPTDRMVSSGYSDLSDLITLNQGTRTDSLGRLLPLGTVFDPTTIRTVGANAVDPVTGLTNPSANAVVVSDPFFTGGSIGGITDFTGLTANLNQLPAGSGRIDQNAVKLLGLYPAATDKTKFANNYYQAAKQTQTINQYDVRIDENISSKDILFGAFSNTNFLMFVPPTLPGIANGQGYAVGELSNPAYSIVVGYTHVFTPTLTNEFRFGFSHQDESEAPAEANTMGIPAQYGIEGVPQTTGNGGLPAINIGGLSGMGVGGWMPTIAHAYTLQLTDNVTKVYGKHTFKGGFEYQYIPNSIFQPAFAKGSFTYNGQFSAIPGQSAGLTGIADALLVPMPSQVGGTDYEGGIEAFSATNDSWTDTRRHYTGIYFQDNWQISQKLTMNLGLRWDQFSLYDDRYGHLANFVPVNGNGPTGTYYLPSSTCNTPVSASFTTLLKQDGITTSCISNGSLGNRQNTNFAPRVGFAYRITPKFVARGGYGIAYGAFATIGYGGTLGTNYPFQFTDWLNSPGSSSPLQLLNGQTATMENALVGLDFEDPTKFNAEGLGLAGRVFNYMTPYTETFNLTLQYQLDRADAIQAGYVGNAGRHLDSQGSYNNLPSEIVPANIGASIYNYIPFPDFAPDSEYLTTEGASTYHSLQVVYTRELAAGLAMSANYTFAKCMMNAAQFQSGIGSYRAQWLPGFGTKADWQECPTDATQVFHVSGQYNLPVGRGQKLGSGMNRAADAVIGGWAVNYLVTSQSGQPFTIPCPIATTAFFGCNANKVPGQNMYAGPHNQTQWLNPDAFANPAVATQIGQSDYSVLGGKGMQARGPRYTNMDASLFKKFSITQSTYLQFRAEAFNLLNHAQFANPVNLDFTNKSEFSPITGLVSNPRLLQFALKLYY
jgi:outer membrane receptor protein involved in Fe transport